MPEIGESRCGGRVVFINRATMEFGVNRTGGNGSEEVFKVKIC